MTGRRPEPEGLDTVLSGTGAKRTSQDNAETEQRKKDSARAIKEITQLTGCFESSLRTTTMGPNGNLLELNGKQEGLTPYTCADFPPLSVHRFSGPALLEGIEIHDIDGVKVRVYCPEKTLADCFRFRNRIGMDIVLEALKLYRARRRFNLSELVRYARLCRVETVMRPYLEALLGKRLRMFQLRCGNAC